MPEQYPCNLPLPLVSSSSYTSSETTKYNDVSNGPLTFELESVDDYLIFDCEFSFSAIEKQVFTSWFHWVLDRGAKSFSINLKSNESTAENETTEYLCYISGVPSYTQNAARWTTKLTLVAVKEL